MDKEYLSSIGVGNYTDEANEMAAIKESILNAYNEKCPHQTLTKEEFDCAVKWAKALIKWDFKTKEVLKSSP